jgi:hypothetical protein
MSLIRRDGKPLDVGVLAAGGVPRRGSKGFSNLGIMLPTMQAVEVRDPINAKQHRLAVDDE